MITFACPKCGKAYTQKESAAGRKFFCGNTSCGQKIQVPEPQEQETADGILLDNPKMAGSKSGEWFYEQDGIEKGPATLADLRHLAKIGNLLPSTRIWTKGLPDWQPADKAVPGLFPKPKKVVVVEDESSYVGGGERGASRWESIGFLLFALIAAGILVVLGYVVVNKLRKDSDTKQEQAKQQGNPPVNPAAAFRDWSEIHKSAGVSVAHLEGNFGSGSGFLIRPGLLVTNSHVISGEIMDAVKISFPADESDAPVKGELIYEDRKRDLALIRIKTPKPTLKLAAVDPPEGKPLATIGSPSTLAKGGTSKNSIRDGILNKVVQFPNGLSYYETSVTLNEGNSGGPLLNSDGEVIGVAVSRAALGRNLYYAIPLLDLRHAIERAESLKKTEARHCAADHDFVFASNYYLCLGLIYEKRIELKATTDVVKQEQLRVFCEDYLKHRQSIQEAVDKHEVFTAEQKQMLTGFTTFYEGMAAEYANAQGGRKANTSPHVNAVKPLVDRLSRQHTDACLNSFREMVKHLEDF